MKKILITGATGLIGQSITKLCHEKDIAVNYLTSDKSKIENKDDYNGFYWNIETNEIDDDCLKDVSAIINLAGAPIAKRWTSNYQKKIIDSRVNAISLLYRTAKKSNYKINQFITASAIGFYPESLTQYYDEAYEIESKNKNFVSDVVERWETAADIFEDLNVSITKLRLGIVLSDKGGALVQMVKPIKNYVGSCFGSGNQWQSWVHIDDVTRLFLFALEHKLEGVFNAVAPNPVTHKVLMKQIANSINRPLILPGIPEFIMNLVLGKMHVLVTKGQRVSSKKVEDLGFNFEYHHLEPTLVNILK